MIGGGQEINRGEAGLAEWGKTVAEKFPHWTVQISPELVSGDHATGGKALFDEIPDYLEIVENEALHLDVSLRAHRAERLSHFVANLLELNPDQCAQIIKTELQNYPIFWTRDLEVAKRWLKRQQRGSRRTGMIIWVPPGDTNDESRLPDFYDATARYLSLCGIPEIAS